jgi:predicted carbohydrate-binding protein with CBM5 and CBM33 domain
MNGIAKKEQEQGSYSQQKPLRWEQLHLNPLVQVP